ncbi:MAG: hypothetical protein JWM80_328 [Cyanobacteria bacterium RYN_339]|nr:hypothetical protein [Cyanobacteria bacterium RYN_339]
MAQNLRLPLEIASKAILALACMSTLAACSRSSSMDPTGGAGASLAAGGLTPRSNPVAQEAVKEDSPPATANVDTAEGPVNLPPIPAAPSTPVDPASMTVKAMGETITLAPASGYAPGLVTSLVRAKVTWTPIKGAVSYRVYEATAKDGQTDSGDKGRLVLKPPTWLPGVIIGGGLAGLGQLAIGQEYVFTVEAVDRAGNIIARGADNCAPLAPLSIPYLKDPGQNGSHVGSTPFFTWTPSNGADGYYVETFGTTRGVPLLPMWRAFRGTSDAMNMQYGQQDGFMEGSKPMVWSLPLNLGARYAWTVCAIRTDTHTMNTCKAIARATAPMYYFTP